MIFDIENTIHPQKKEYETWRMRQKVCYIRVAPQVLPVYLNSSYNIFDSLFWNV